MKATTYCLACLIQRQEERIRKYADEDKKTKYLKEVMNMIATSREDASAPHLIGKIQDIHIKYFGDIDSYIDLKKEYNQVLISKEIEINKLIKQSQNKLITALKYARAGNYIDFGAMKEISNDKLEELLSTAENENIDSDEYQRFFSDLSSAKNLVYLTDNCGEIVLDKLLIITIKEYFPKLTVTTIVRGRNILNDATYEDAKQVGMTEITRVVGNGTNIPGTSLSEVSKEAREIIDSADIVISKGQANFESLYGCGLNIYYMFLCKCELFVKRFKMEKFKGVFINEKNVCICKEE